MDIFFTTNDSEIPRLEGLYIKERNPPAAIQGANLNTTAVAAQCIRGPVGRCIEIDSPARLKEIFGDRDQGSGGAISSNLFLAMLNKPFGTMLVSRVSASAATSSTLILTGAASATGTIQTVTFALMVDAETVTISDGVTSKIYEFDKTGDGVVGGHVTVNISGAVSAQDCANALISAINGSGQTLVAASSNSTGLIALTNTVAGVAGNVTITETVANAGFTVSGMAGGTASGTALLRADASSPGVWGNQVSVAVAVASDGSTAHSNVTATYLGQTFSYKNIDISKTGTDNTLATLGSDTDANVITLTKLASGVPAVAAAAALAGGSDGTIADADYIAALDLAAVAKDTAGNGAGVVFVAEYSSAALKAEIQILAAASSDRLFLCCPTTSSVSVSTAATEAATFTRSDRIVYCYNHAYTLDPATATEVLTHPTGWLASVLSQIDIDIHPGEEDTKPFLAGITRLYNPGLARGDYIALKSAGICALERDNGYSFVSGVTTSLTPGKEEITRRRSADFIQISGARALKSQVKKKNTISRRKAIVGLLDSFLGGLKSAERVVEAYLIDDDSLNSSQSRGQGVERILIRVRLIGHILQLVLETEIGQQVSITERG